MRIEARTRLIQAGTLYEFAKAHAEWNNLGDFDRWESRIGKELLKFFSKRTIQEAQKALKSLSQEDVANLAA